MYIQKAAERFGTPLYLYHYDVLRRNYQTLHDAIIPGARLYYSMKANPLGSICRALNELGAGIEVASKGEMKAALEAGISPRDIIFTSPGKTEAELRMAIDNRIKLINIDSPEEAEMIDQIGREKKQVVDILIRINPATNDCNAKIKMTGVASQFGIEEEELDEAYAVIRELEFVHVCGFHVYMGTQMLHADDIVKNTDYALNLFRDKAEKYGIDLKIADVGGGFGVKYFSNETDLDIGSLRAQMRDVFEKYKKDLEGTEIIFESGRYITAEAGEFITKVLHVKRSKGTKYVICDGGSNFHSAAAFLGRFVRNNFPLRTIPAGVEKETTNIVGPLCTALDVIGQKIPVNKEIKSGDYVIIENSGAYGLTYSPLEFLSHERPNEIMVKDGVFFKV